MTKPGMSDGRVFTTFIPNCKYNDMIKEKYKKMNNNEYRIFLQENAEKVMNDMKTMSMQNLNDSIDRGNMQTKSNNKMRQ
tara:strand:+ start:586 stop:825 length:240 start_codon:yes stop_codon:yes gene_type:complete